MCNNNVGVRGRIMPPYPNQQALRFPPNEGMHQHQGFFPSPPPPPHMTPFHHQYQQQRFNARFLHEHYHHHHQQQLAKNNNSIRMNQFFDKNNDLPHGPPHLEGRPHFPPNPKTKMGIESFLGGTGSIFGDIRAGMAAAAFKAANAVQKAQLALQENHKLPSKNHGDNSDEHFPSTRVSSPENVDATNVPNIPTETFSKDQDIVLESQGNAANGDLTDEDGHYNTILVNHSDMPATTYDNEDHLRKGSSNVNSDEAKLHGEIDRQNSAEEEKDSATYGISRDSAEPPIVEEAEKGQKEKWDKNVEQRASSFFEYGNLVEEEEVELLHKQSLASKKMEECSSSKTLKCANETEKEGTNNNGNLRGIEPGKEGDILLEEQGLQPRLTCCTLQNQRRANSRTSMSNLLQVNSSGISIDDETTSVTEVQGTLDDEVLGEQERGGDEVVGELDDLRYKEGEKQELTKEEMTRKGRHEVRQEGALSSNVLENDAIQKDLRGDKLDDEEDGNNDDGKIRTRQESEKEGYFTTDVHRKGSSGNAPQAEKTEQLQQNTTKNIDCLSGVVTTSISQHAQSLHTSSSTLLTSSAASSGYADLNAVRTISSPSSQSLGGITSNGLDAPNYSPDIQQTLDRHNTSNNSNLISSSTTNNSNPRIENPEECNINSDNNLKGLQNTSEKQLVDVNSNSNQTVTPSSLVLPDTTTNTSVDATNGNVTKQQDHCSNWNKLYNNYHQNKNFRPLVNNLSSTPPTNNNNFLREFLHGKLALAAAVAQRQQLQHANYQQRNFGPPPVHHPQYRGTFPPHFRPPPPPPHCLPPQQSLPIGPHQHPSNQFGGPIYPFNVNRFFHHPSTLRNPAMEPALLSSGGVPHDFSSTTRHNNNDLKESAAVAANLMHLIKMRQDALNSAAATNGGSNISDNSPRSVEDNDDSNKLTDAEEEPIDLQRTNHHDGRSSVQSSDGELLGRASPSSDAGMSSSSGKDPTKSSRLEQIVSSMRNSSPLPGSNSSQSGTVVNGCKKRKLYQPVQHEKSPTSTTSDKEFNSPSEYEKATEDDDMIVEDDLQIVNEDLHQPENKKKRTKHNDENADPSTDHDNNSFIDLAEQNENCSMPPIRQRAKQVRDSTKIHNKDRITPLPPGIPSSQHPSSLPLHHGGHMPMNPLQLHMEMAKHFRQIQEQQDKIAKEAITKEIINETINKNNLIDGKLAAQIAANCPEMQGLAGLLKSEITASLDAVMTPIIEGIVGRFLQARRMPLGSKPFSLDDASALLGSVGNTFPLGNNNTNNGVPSVIPHLPPLPTLKQQVHSGSPASGRAPQVRDRAGPRMSSAQLPMSMANPLTAISQSISQSIASAVSISSGATGGSHILPLPPSLRPAPTVSANSDKTPSVHDDDSDNGTMPEQDEALSLVVTPKKKRHKVTDTRITPRTMSRVLGNESNIMSDLHKHLSSGNHLPFPPPLSGLPTPRSEANGMNDLSPRLPGARATPGMPPIIPGFPGAAGILPPLPTSVAIPNPSLADFNPFSSFYSPPLPKPLGSDLSKLVGDDLSFGGRSKTPGSPPHHDRRERERRRSAGVDRDSPANLLSRPTLLNSPDFANFSRSGDSEKGSSNNDQDEFDRSLQQLSGMCPS